MARSNCRVFGMHERVRGLVWCLLPLLLTGSVAMSQTPATPAANTSEFECVIEPQQVVKLASPVVGMVARLDVDRGDIVRENQILGKIEDRVEAATLALARARATNDAASYQIRQFACYASRGRSGSPGRGTAAQ
jgi:multidrug efflux pump subunit AcrA (membrane-fusion protein)